MGEFRKEMDVRYRRSCNHNYLVITGPEETDPDYQMEMISENRISGLLPVECRECEGRKELYYEISSLQPLSRIYEHKEFSWEELRGIVKGILDVYETVQDYLLDDVHVVLEAEQIYMNLDDRRISLIFCPYYRETRENGFLHLAEYVLEHVDHRDPSAAMFAYQLYKIVRQENFVLDEIRRALEESDSVQKEKEIPMLYAEKAGPEARYPEERFPAEEQEDEEDDADEEDVPRKKFPLLPILLILFGSLVAFGLIPGIRSGSTRPLTAGLLWAIGVVMLLLSVIQKKPPRNPKPEEIFPDPEPSFDDILFAEPVCGENEDEEYGKTVFIEPEKEELRYILKEKGRSKEYAMTAFPFTIGKVRDCVDLALPDSSVSRIHARILRVGGALCLQDCRSTNGTFLNGMRLDAEEQVMLEKGDEVGIGKLRFELI